VHDQESATLKPLERSMTVKGGIGEKPVLRNSPINMLKISRAGLGIAASWLKLFVIVLIDPPFNK
jgi:hypothetical protein